jgi:LDH2 family malate/lactate/ureidoglycolate dehydrogenase
MPATAGMMGSVLISGYGGKDLVAPWGGREPRLAANPLSWAAPTGYVWPFLVDITTSVVPEGKVRVALNAGKQLPEGCLLDQQGIPATNPADLYPPNGGALLTFGGIVGHKGYSLNLVAEMFVGALSGMGCRGFDNGNNGNGVFLQAFDISRFLPLERFIESVQGLIAHLRSCPPQPGVEEVLIPGEVEYWAQRRLLEEGIPVSDGTWKGIEEAAAEFCVAM